MHHPDGGGMHHPDGGGMPTPDSSAGPDSGADALADASAPPGIGDISGSGGIKAMRNGNNVSIDDTWLVLGDESGTCYAGVASFYAWDGVSSWNLATLVDDPDPAPSGSMLENLNCFGAATAVHGDTAFVSSPDQGSFAGAVYVFTESGGTWTQSSSISDGSLGTAYFGYALAYDGERVAIGAPATVQAGNTYTGIVEVYVSKGGRWTLQRELTSPVPTEAACFGTSVALTGTRLAVGANGAPNQQYENTGYAYTYQVTVSGPNTTWAYEADAIGTDTAATDGFGNSVALADGSGGPDLLVVGAPNASPIASGSGAAYVFYFDSTNGTWLENAKLIPADGAGGDQFGYTVAAISSTQVVVGAPGASKVYVYTYAGADTWTLTTTYQSCPVSIGSNLASWSTLIATGKTSDVVIDTSLTSFDGGCGGN
jgi:hypothetical protein